MEIEIVYDDTEQCLTIARGMVFDDTAECSTEVNILHEYDDTLGLIAMVYDIDGKRFYQVFDFTYDGTEWNFAYGYKADQRYYMGEIYRKSEIWGEYLSEIY